MGVNTNGRIHILIPIGNGNSFIAIIQGRTDSYNQVNPGVFSSLYNFGPVAVEVFHLQMRMRISEHNLLSV
jgi:hypothetical protein